MAGYSQLAGNQWKKMLPNGWKFSNGWKFLNGWKLVERLDDDKWLEISRKAGDCQMAGNEFQFIGPKKSENCNKIIILLLLHELFLKIVV